jgi:small nuclear ribonucleoprotein (snRNP)-like protein
MPPTTGEDLTLPTDEVTKATRRLAENCNAELGSCILSIMRVLTRGMLLLAICAAARPACADEIQLKDGKTFYGTIVGYDNNMFKIKTDFGYILVEKSKIASIVPNGTPSAKGGTNAPASAGKNESDVARSGQETEAVKSKGAQPTAEPAVISTYEKPVPRISNAPVRPEIPTNAPKLNAVAPSLKGAPTTTTNSLVATDTALAPAKGIETPQIPEEVQGNTYINHVYGFRIYKAPSWQLIDDATELPNAIVAMGTQNESTLLVVGREKNKQSLDAAANVVEKRLHEVYDDYRQTSQRKTVVGGLPAVEYRYRGKAEEHDWSGTLVVVARGSDILTALGMTYADTDLIQIQENVITRAIASLDFNVR